MKGRLSDHLRPLRLDAPTSGSIARRGALSMAGLLAQGGLRFATSWLVGRVAGRAALGVVQSALSTGTLLALLWPTVTGSAASKFLARARGADNPGEVAAVARHLSRRTMQSVALLAAATIPVWMLIDGGSALSAIPVAAFVVAYSGYSYTRGIQFGTGQVERATTWDVISAAIGLVTVAAALTVGVRGTALLLPLVLSYSVYTAASWPRGARGTLSRSLRRELDHFVVLGVAGTLASTGFLQLSMVVASASGDADEAGQYAAALATATPASMVAISLSLTLFPTLAESWGRGDAPGFRRQTDLAVRVLVVVMVALFGTLIVCSRIVMSIWGPGFDPTDPVFPILLAAILSTSLGVATVNALLARSSRGIRVTTSASLGGMLVGLLLWALLVPTLSTLGVAVGYLAGAMLTASVPFAVVWWKDEHRWGGLVVRLVGGLMVLAAIAVVQRVLDPPLWTDPLAAVFFLGIWVLLAPVRLATVRDHVRAMRAGEPADG